MTGDRGAVKWFRAQIPVMERWTPGKSRQPRGVGVIDVNVNRAVTLTVTDGSDVVELRLSRSEIRSLRYVLKRALRRLDQWEAAGGTVDGEPTAEAYWWPDDRSPGSHDA